jgi:hypothetical protein
MNKTFFLALIGFTLNLSSCYYDVDEELNPPLVSNVCDTTASKFAADIQPILNSNCATSGCHTTVAIAAGYIFDNYTDVKSTIDSDSARFVGSITHAANISPMPKGGGKLSDCNISKIKAWIASGAPDN